jgi:hypothetical protein
MVKRSTRKTKKRKAARKPARRKTVRRKTARKKTARSPKETVTNNWKAHWSVYKDLQKKAGKAWSKLRSDVKLKAAPHILLADRNNLLLLLGECNYLAEECMRIDRKRR